MKFFVTLICLIILRLSLFADENPFSLQTEISSNQVQLGQSFTVALDLTFPKNYQPDAPKIVERLLRGVNLLAPKLDLIEESIHPPTALTENSMQQKIQLKLRSLTPGKFHLDFLIIPFLSEKTEQLPYNLAGKMLTIEILIPETAKTAITSIIPQILPFSQDPLVTVDKENISPLGEPVKNLRVWNEHDLPPLWKMILYTFLILMLWNHKFIKDVCVEINERWKKMKDPKKYALDALQKIINDKNRQTAQLNPEMQQYYIQLSDILRDYLEQKHKLPAKHKTTPEFLEFISKKTDFNNLHKLLLAELLKNADLVKFAKYKPTNEDCEHAITATKQFIEAH